MLAAVEPIQVVVLGALAAVVGYLAVVGDPRTWHARLSERLLYGVPWGTIVSMCLVVAFYLFAQSGLQYWGSPVTLAFRSWSYLYPEGLFAAGFAHAGPDHLLANMVGTVVLAPIVEYGWSHYPPAETTAPYEYPPPGEVRSERTASDSGAAGLLGRPWFRAVVVFPAVVIFVSVLTSLLALGWSLGFSGTVFAFGGFAVVFFPLAAVLAMVGLTGTGVVVSTLREPVLRATAEPGAPGPPGWWGVNVQAHMLGFLIGVLLGVVLLRYRGEDRQTVRVFLAALAFGLTRQLWAFALSGEEDVYLQYRGVGLVFLVAVSMLVGAAVGTREEPIPALVPLSRLPDRRTLALLWLAAVLGVGGLLWIPVGFASTDWFDVALFVLVVVILAVPGLPSVLPDRVVSTPITQRQLVIAGLVVVIVVVAVPSAISNAPGMDPDPVPGDAAVTIEDYHVTYAEEVPHGRFGSNESGVIVVSERREIWSAVVEKSTLAHDGEATVTVGGFGWRETVDVNRTAWAVAGGEDVYAVELTDDSVTRRVFESDPSAVQSRIANRTVRVHATGDGFILNVTRNGTSLATGPIPSLNETRRFGGLAFSTELDDGDRAVFATREGTRVLIASRAD